jgi:hypothetical protein
MSCRKRFSMEQDAVTGVGRKSQALVVRRRDPGEVHGVPDEPRVSPPSWAKQWILLTEKVKGHWGAVSPEATRGAVLPEATNPISAAQSGATFSALLFVSGSRALCSTAYSMIAPAMMQPRPITISAAPKCKRPLEEGYGLLCAAAYPRRASTMPKGTAKIPTSSNMTACPIGLRLFLTAHSAI